MLPPANVSNLVHFELKQFLDRAFFILGSFFVYIAAIECPSLSLTEGSVAYAADTSPDFSIGTVATHSCSAGFALVGDATRTCMDDDQADIVGVWSGSAPTCERKYTLVNFFI